MSIPRPKFCVGELVDVVTRGERIENVEIILMEYKSKKEYKAVKDEVFIVPPGWQYALNLPRKDNRALEKNLRKRPHNYWQDSVWTPEEVTA